MDGSRNKIIISVFLYLLLGVGLTIVNQSVLEVLMVIAVIISSAFVVSISLVSKKYIINKGLLFIGISYILVAFFSVFYLVGKAGYINIVDGFNFEQFFFLAKYTEIILFVLGFLFFFNKSEIKFTRVVIIELVIFTLLVVYLTSSKLYPLTTEVDLLATVEFYQSLLIIGLYTLILVVIFVRKTNLHGHSLLVHSMFIVYLLSETTRLFDSSYLMTLSYMLRSTGMIFFVYFLYIEGVKNPLVIACEEVEKSRDKLLELSRIDELTMIANRRYLFENIAKSFRLAKREDHSICFLMIDIDDFKGYNDTFGHIQGDRILQRVAKAITKACKRPLDFAGRYGGEEFLVVLPNSDFESAMTVSNRIMKNIRDLRIVHFKDEKKFLSVSIGFSVIHPAQNDRVDLAIRIADEFLYKVKGTGKNGVMGTIIEEGDKDNETTEIHLPKN